MNRFSFKLLRPFKFKTVNIRLADDDNTDVGQRTRFVV